ncbi:MAG: protein arginine kinase [Vallitaleaceae bacterium]|jgi:protein arginine kinase|nr:protein arginine kinase [Vallitaleaceae bacterium]
MKWYEKENETYHGIIISSRIRLARNLRKYNFPSKLSDDDSIKVIDIISDAIASASDHAVSLFEKIDMQNISQIDKIAMMERHIISPIFIRDKIPSALILSKDESLSIMINEEDHIRIQSMEIGMNLYTALANAYHVDDLLEEKLDVAFDPSLGYLTACPTNVGTGMRASYMIHLPALETTGKLRFLLDAIGKFGLTVRGMHGEGSDAQGSLFQISNQITLGVTDEEIIDNLTSVTKQIIEQELVVRNKLIDEKRLEFEDAVYRSYGILKHVRILPSKEAMTLLSDIKLGLELGIIKTAEEKKINIFDLMTCIQPANLQKLQHKELNIEDRDIARATFIRENLPDLIE